MMNIFGRPAVAGAAVVESFLAFAEFFVVCDDDDDVARQNIILSVDQSTLLVSSIFLGKDSKSPSLPVHVSYFFASNIPPPVLYLFLL